MAGSRAIGPPGISWALSSVYSPGGTGAKGVPMALRGKPVVLAPDEPPVDFRRIARSPRSIARRRSPYLGERAFGTSGRPTRTQKGLPSACRGRRQDPAFPGEELKAHSPQKAQDRLSLPLAVEPPLPAEPHRGCSDRPAATPAVPMGGDCPFCFVGTSLGFVPCLAPRGKPGRRTVHRLGY